MFPETGRTDVLRGGRGYPGDRDDGRPQEAGRFDDRAAGASGREENGRTPSGPAGGHRAPGGSHGSHRAPGGPTGSHRASAGPPRGARGPAAADETAVLPQSGPKRPGPGFDPTARPPATGPAGNPAAKGAAGPSGVLRDPWGDAPAAGGTDSEATHDPHEVTVQLDAVQFGEAGGLRPAASGPARGAQEPSDGPVFVDESGRRSRRFRRLGIAVGLACAVYAVVIVVTLLSGSSDAPWLPVPGQNDDKPASKVDTTPLPADSAAPADDAGVPPGSTPTASDGTTPSAGSGGATPGSSSSAAEPGSSADPRPTATKSTAGTGTGAGAGGTGTGGGKPSTPTASAPSDDPPNTDPGTGTGGTGGSDTSDPPSPTATAAGSNTVADGPADPSPVAQEPRATASTEPSPEHIL